jgi:hypothetical protein
MFCIDKLPAYSIGSRHQAQTLHPFSLSPNSTAEGTQQSDESLQSRQLQVQLQVQLLENRVIDEEDKKR